MKDIRDEYARNLRALHAAKPTVDLYTVSAAAWNWMDAGLGRRQQSCACPQAFTSKN
jgi:hypothetical protein